MSALVVVSTKPEIQRQRLLARNPELSAADADARIAAQMPLAEKEAVADYVIRNDGSLSDLKQRTLEVLEALRASILEKSSG